MSPYSLWSADVIGRLANCFACSCSRALQIKSRSCQSSMRARSRLSTRTLAERCEHISSSSSRPPPAVVAVRPPASSPLVASHVAYSRRKEQASRPSGQESVSCWPSNSERYTKTQSGAARFWCGLIAFVCGTDCVGHAQSRRPT